MSCIRPTLTAGVPMGWCWSSGTEFTKAFKSACAGSGKRRKAWKMKWLLHAAIGTLLAIAAEAEAAEPAPIHKAPAVIAVDGVLDEPAWKQAQVVKADYVWGQVGQRSAQRQMRVRYTWDDHYLYVGYETFDRNLMALGTGKKEGPRDNLREGCAIADHGKWPTRRSASWPWFRMATSRNATTTPVPPNLVTGFTRARSTILAMCCALSRSAVRERKMTGRHVNIIRCRFWRGAIRARPGKWYWQEPGWTLMGDIRHRRRWTGRRTVIR